MTTPIRSAQDVKNAALSGWVNQLKKQIKHFQEQVADTGHSRPSLEHQVLFVQQQYELLSMLYEVSLGFDNPNGVRRIIGVDADSIVAAVPGAAEPDTGP